MNLEYFEISTPNQKLCTIVIFVVLFKRRMNSASIIEQFFFHSCTVNLGIIKVFIYQLMQKRVALKEY